MYYIIYKITNTLNGKYYIGKHQTTDLNDGYLGSGKLLKRAIEKYGVEHFTKEILHIFDNEVEMNAKEKELVVICEESYNLCPGGRGGFGYINANLDLTEIRIKNLEKSRTPEKIKEATAHSSSTMKRTHELGKITHDRRTFLGKRHTPETKEKMSQSKKGKTSGEKNSQFGTVWLTNGTQNIKVQKSLIDLYLSNGFYKGRTV